MEAERWGIQMKETFAQAAEILRDSGASVPFRESSLPGCVIASLRFQ
jgi:hypothetical protein